jgi:hypothetical protein
MTLITLATISAELMCSERKHRKEFVTDIGRETRGKRIAVLVEDATLGRQRSLPVFRSLRHSAIACRFMLVSLRAAFSIRNGARPGLLSVRNF